MRGLELVHGTQHRSAGARRPAPPARVRVVDGALSCIAAQGVARTTLDDVARNAGCSRATVYRLFPGGKDAVMQAAADTEVSRFFSALAVCMGEAHDLEDVLVAGMTEAARRVSEHEALGALLEHEPELVLPRLAFSHMDEVLATTCTFVAPFLGRWLDSAEARRVAEWAARIVVSYLACPAEGVDITDVAQVRGFVRQFVLPGIRALQSAPGAAPLPQPTRTRDRNDHNRPNHTDPVALATEGAAS